VPNKRSHPARCTAHQGIGNHVLPALLT
jgi:hypothetical protein